MIKMQYKSEGSIRNLIAFGREKKQEYGEEYMQLLNYINDHEKERNWSEREIEEMEHIKEIENGGI